jgi:hypothetical protein
VIADVSEERIDSNFSIEVLTMDTPIDRLRPNEWGAKVA